jgi:hypothetical protein
LSVVASRAGSEQNGAINRFFRKKFNKAIKIWFDETINTAKKTFGWFSLFLGGSSVPLLVEGGNLTVKL